jgi:hypothetical protein
MTSWSGCPDTIWWLMRRVPYQDSVMRDHAAAEEWREAEAADLRAQVKASQSQ